jgi:hypothetical protein
MGREVAMDEAAVGEDEIRAAAAWLAEWSCWRWSGADLADDLRQRAADRVEFPVRLGSVAYADGTYGEVWDVLVVDLEPGRVMIVVPLRDGSHEIHCAYWQPASGPGRSACPGP